MRLKGISDQGFQRLAQVTLGESTMDKSEKRPNDKDYEILSRLLTLIYEYNMAESSGASANILENAFYELASSLGFSPAVVNRWSDILADNDRDNLDGLKSLQEEGLRDEEDLQ